MWSGLVPRMDQGETGLRSVRQGNEELIRVMKRKGYEGGTYGTGGNLWKVTG